MCLLRLFMYLFLVEESGWSLYGLMDFAQALDLVRDSNEKLKVAGILIVNEETLKSKQLKNLQQK